MNHSIVNRILSTALCAGALCPFLRIEAQALEDVVSRQREELTAQLRELRPMTYNFPCKEIPTCLSGKKVAELDRVKAYEQVKRDFQEGLIRVFEKDLQRANLKFDECARRIDSLLESLSQSYVDRAKMMLQTAIEKRDPADRLDLSLVDIIVEFGPRSQLRDEMTDPRDPGTRRSYEPKLYRYVLNRDRIGSGLARGFEYLAQAEAARKNALAVQTGDPAKGTLPASLLPLRISHYLAAIHSAMLAKSNAEIIFRLKYPYVMYALLNPNGRHEAKKGTAGASAEIAGVQMQWGNHPFVLPKHLRAAFDLRVPEEYRRDTVDLRARVYEDELERYVRLGVDPQKAAALRTGGAGPKAQ